MSTKRYRALSWIVILGAAAAVLVATAWLFLPRPYDSSALLGRIHASVGIETRFSEILPDPLWDTVCYLDPYDRPSRSLARHLSEDLTGFRFEPYDQYIAEEEHGLAFVDHESRVIYVYALPKVSAQPGRALYRVEGPRCLSERSAGFTVERVEAPNLTYDKLVFTRVEATLLESLPRGRIDV